MSEELENALGSTCAELREKRKENVRYETLVESYSDSLVDIISHVIGTCDCSTVEEPINSRDDEPWRERFVIETLYLEQDMRFTEMADVLDCHSETAKKYVDEFDVSPIDSSNRTSSPRVNKLQRLGAEHEGDIKIKDE